MAVYCLSSTEYYPSLAETLERQIFKWHWRHARGVAPHRGRELDFIDPRRIKARKIAFRFWLMDIVLPGPVFLEPLFARMLRLSRRPTWFTQVSHKKARPRLIRWRNA